MARTLEIVLVDAHEVFREGMRAIVSTQGHRIVGEADCVRAAGTLIASARFDLLIVDSLLPGASGVSLLRELRRLRRAEPSLVLGSYAHPYAAAEALAAGATGFALKSDSRERLLGAIEDVAERRAYLSPSLPRGSVEALVLPAARGGATLGPLAALSFREREIFGLLARGYDARAVARELCISPKTVDTHRAHIFGKLDLHSLADLVRFAYQNELVHTARPQEIASAG
jgi:DNA-binding NarL/FixJ family response regulator